MDREKDSAFFDPTFVAFRFVLRNPHADQGSRDTSDNATRTRSGQRCHNRAGCDERSQAGDCQRANAC